MKKKTNKKSKILGFKMKLLQFQCEKCKFKFYINLEDEKIEPLPEILTCINCLDHTSVKKRVLKIILQDYLDFKAKCPTCGRSN